MPLPGDRLYANSIWIGPANADNYMVGRNGYHSTGVVMHHSAGTLDALIYRFEHPPATSGGGASAHFAVSREEEIRDGLLGHRAYAIRYQLVDTADMAFADANYFENLTTDAIEHVRQWGSGPGTAGWEPILDSQYASSTELVMILAKDEGWEINAANVTPHNLYTQTTCPGDLDLARIISGDISIPVNLSEKRALVRLAYVAGMGREPESQDALAGWANQINDDGTNAEETVTRILDSAESVAHLAAIKAAGPPGPAGATGPAGKDGGLTPHAHTYGGTTN